MHTYTEAFQLAIMSARHSRIAANKRVARALWKMAQEYQAEAGKLDNYSMPVLGEPPQGLELEDQVSQRLVGAATTPAVVGPRRPRSRYPDPHSGVGVGARAQGYTSAAAINHALACGRISLWTVPSPLIDLGRFAHPNSVGAPSRGDGPWETLR